MQTDILLVTYTVLLPTNPCCSITELLRHPSCQQSFSFACSILVYSKKEWSKIFVEHAQHISRI